MAARALLLLELKSSLGKHLLPDIHSVYLNFYQFLPLSFGSNGEASVSCKQLLVFGVGG